VRHQRGEEELKAAILLHVRHALTNTVKRIPMEHTSSWCEDGLSGVKISLQRDSLIERRIVGIYANKLLGVSCASQRKIRLSNSIL